MFIRSFLPTLLAAVLVGQLMLIPAEIVNGAGSFVVPQRLMQKAQRQKTVRVIVRLNAPPTAESDTESDLEIASRRRSIAFARASTRATLSHMPHRVIHEFQDFPLMALSLNHDGLQALESLRGVVTEVIEDQLNAPFLAESIPLVQADQAWAGGFAGLSLDGTGTVIAVIDTGVDKNHSFLSDKVIREACFSSNDASLSATSVCPGGAETSIGAGSGVPCNANGCEHGTHVAGIAAGGSIAGFAGIAPGAGVMAIQVFSQFSDPFICRLTGFAAPCALAFNSDILAGLQHVYSQRSLLNIAAVNMSLGGQTSATPCSTDPRASIIRSLRTANIATVVASGNDGETARISAPACVPDAVSVGSTGDGSGGSTIDEVSWFTNSATFLSLLAPGDSIISAIPGGGFAAFSGTSMATAHVSGAFAILKQAAPNATVSQMLAALQNSGQPVFDPLNGLTKPRIKILDALAAGLPSVQFDAANYTVDENKSTATITATRSGVAVGTLTVKYATSDGTATAGLDYTAKTATLTFLANQTTKTFTVSIKNDTINEASETINLALSNPVGGLLGSQSIAVLTVNDNDGPGVIQFSAASYTVSESGARSTITLTRTGGSASGVGVTYATSDGTATAGSDYSATTGTLTFAANQTSKTFTIPITNDTIVEGNETINLSLSNPTGGAALGAQNIAVLTITDNDLGGTLQFSATAYSVSETRPTATLTVRRTGGTASAVTVNYATTNDTATDGQDYTATSGLLTFASGQSSKTFTIPIVNDTLDDGNRTVLLALANATGGAVLGALSSAVLTIIDNDASGTVQFRAATYSVNETGSSATITVTRSGGTASGGTVDYTTSNGTATAGVDYAAASGTLTFNAGETSKTFAVTINNDGDAEGNETVKLSLSNPNGGATLGARAGAVLTIVDDEMVTNFQSANFTVGENSSRATITVTRSGPTTAPVTVDYATSNGSATDGQDYTASTGTLNFAAGQVNRTFTIPVINDTLDENNETVNLTLSNPTGGVQLGTQNTALLTITDNDIGGILQFSAATYTVSETRPTATLTVRRTGGTASAVTVNYATANDTATDGQDYTATSGLLTFASGQSSKTFTIPIVNDTLDESNETVNIALSNATGGAVLGANSSAVLTINDND